MKQTANGLTLRAAVLALALILAAVTSGLSPLGGVAYAQGAAPVLTAQTTPANDAVSLSWTAVAGVDSYEVWKHDGGWGTGALTTVTVTDATVLTYTYSDSAIVAGKTYWYAVVGVTAGVKGAWSNVPSVTIPGGTQPPASAPTLTATANGLTTVDVAWTAVTGATAYELHRWNGSTNAWDLIDSTLTGMSYSDTGLTPGTTYWYIARATNAGGPGPWSAYASATLQATTTVPELTLTHTSRTVVDLSWTPTGTSGVTYDLERRRILTDDATTPNTGMTAFARLPDTLLSATSYTDNAATWNADNTATGLTGVGTGSDVVVKVEYEYRVRSVVNSVNGSWSETKKVSIPETGVRPAAPAITLSPGTDYVRVTWANVPGAASYELQSKKGEDGSWSNVMTVTSPYTHGSLDSGTSYTYRVRSRNINGPSDWATKSVTTQTAGGDDGRLPTPTGLTVADATSTTGGTTTYKLDVSWDEVSGADGYSVMVWTAGAWTAVSDSVNTPLTDTEVTFSLGTATTDAGATRYFTVRAAQKLSSGSTDYTGGTFSDWSGYVSGTTQALTLATAPAGFTVTPTGASTIWASWTAVTGATKYTLQWRASGASATWNSITVTDGTGYNHTGRASNTEYFYRVRAENADSMSPWTDSEPVTTWAAQLATPGGVTAEGASTTSIEVSWDAVTGATGYEVQKWSAANSWWGDFDGNNSGAVQAVTDTTATDSDSGLAANTTYYYIVRATSGAVKSKWSAAVGAKVKYGTPSAPTLTVTTVGQSTIRVSWTAVANATSYELISIEGAAVTADFTRSAVTKTPVTLTDSDIHYTHSGLKHGQRYSYAIKAMLPGDVETALSAVKQTVTKPPTPQLTVATVSANEMKLTWDAVELDGSDLSTANGSQYTIQHRSADMTDWQSVTLAGTVCNAETKKCTFTVNDAAVDTDLTANTLHTFRIRASSSTSPASNPTTLTSYWDYESGTTSPASN